jgi:hypothetical protein
LKKLLIFSSTRNNKIIHFNEKIIHISKLIIYFKKYYYFKINNLLKKLLIFSPTDSKFSKFRTDEKISNFISIQKILFFELNGSFLNPMIQNLLNFEINKIF